MTISLAAHDVSLSYAGGDPVVTGLHLAVRPGEVVSVLGASGCGKSTLLRALAGLHPVAGGTLTADQDEVRRPGKERALVFQDDALLPWRTAVQNVELPLSLRGVGRRQRRRQALEWLDRVGLPHAAHRLPRELSGGMRQRVQLARSLAAEPGAILMDEPFGALDAQSRATMQRVLVHALEGTSATVVFVTHDVDEALLLGDRVVVLENCGVRTEVAVPAPRDFTAPPPSRERATLLAALTGGATRKAVA
jgi:NitT/TauT family transport system ATP-binding protein